MLGVVMNHATANALAKMPTTENWNLASLMICIVTPAVPLFFMLSGATILNSYKTASVGYLFKHRLIRVVVPFILWSLITMIFFQLMDSKLDWNVVGKSMRMIIHKPTLEAYWFMYPLIGFYLLSPILKSMIDHIDLKILDYAIILWLVTNFLIPTLSHALPNPYGRMLDVYEMGSLMFLSKSLGYFLLGYRLSLVKKDPITPLNNVLFSFFILVIMIFINYLNYEYKNIDIPIIGYAPAILTPILASFNFLFFKQIGGTASHKESRILAYIAPLAYGVYLVHGIGIRIAQEFVHDSDFISVFGIATIFSLVLIWFLSRIPLINKLLT
ncbi:acyltransferase 3 [Companilactobacillus nodensis DSM 19682 = JCM 14932 = NBRC 107160]|uniref:Acyltransferase 3 n=3 Tax=Companilactobacillus nodensis TaxID=460870 RepID=A0A0R1K9W8_9LACO|nr:acyltransferase 3 [Companilactobacillus nodensis DSM 19682 = JCM 14932 = NBRC 107160]